MGNLWAYSGELIFPAMALLIMLYLYICHGRKKRLLYVVGGIVLLTTFIIAQGSYRAAYKQRQELVTGLKEGETLTVCARVVKKEHKSNSFLYYLKGDSYNHFLIKSDVDDYQIGEILKLCGKVNKFNRASNEGGFDEEGFYFAMGYYYRLKVEKVIGIVEPECAYGEYFFDIREKMGTALVKAMGERQGGVLTAMLWGEKSWLDGEIKELYQMNGISHILSISGLHLSIVALGIYRLLRRIGCSYSGAGLVAFFMGGLYLLVTGAAISTQRALGMLGLLILAQIMGRSNDLLNSLGGVVLCLVIMNPFITAYMGLWFSIAALVGIGFVARTYGRKTGLAIGIMLASLPVVAFCYYEVTLWSPLINVIVLPLLGFLLVDGILGSVVGLFSVRLAKLLLYPGYLILGFYQWLGELMERLPVNQIIVGRPTLWQIIGYYLFLLLTLRLLTLRKESKYIRLYRLLSVLFLMSLWLIPFPRLGDQFQISFLDVGQGDGIYLSTAEGEEMFFDGGSSSKSRLGEYTLLPFLKSRGIREVDYWFISHMDEDHSNGIKEVLGSNIRIKNLVVSKMSFKSEAFEELRLLAEEKDTEIRIMKKGDRLLFGSSRLICLGPVKEKTDINADCLVLRYEDDERSVLLGGDISSKEEEELLEEYGSLAGGLLDVDIFKANHHGSKFSNSRAFIRAVSPRITVISCGKNNRYGHPHREVLKLIEMEGSDLRRTDMEGQIMLGE